MKKTIRENKKWRIILNTSDKDTSVFVNDFYVGRPATRCRLRLGKATATLETKQRFLWKTFWSRQEFTNITNVVQEWIAKYFGEVIKVTPTNNRKIIDGVEYEISDFDGGQRYFVETNGRRGNPAHTPEKGKECGCSGCDGLWI